MIVTDFSKVKKAVSTQFASMAKSQLLHRVNVDNDCLWEAYLASFPEGSNPMHKERTEHDCTCCKQFVRAMGGVVSVKGDTVSTIWDTPSGDPSYDVVQAKMRKLVLSQPIVDLFLTSEPRAGTDKSRQLLGDKTVNTWDHFFVNIPTTFVRHKDAIPSGLSDIRSTAAVFERSLKELTQESVEVVMELIRSNSLYRGAERMEQLKQFYQHQLNYAKAQNKNAYVWANLVGDPAVTRIRSTAMGTLLIDLSEGMELENAVARYENTVSGTNYKRPTALVTQKMVKDAQQKIVELGLSSALERRYASLSDISIDNVLFADRNTKNSMKGAAVDVFEMIATEVTSTKVRDLSKVESMSIDAFIQNVLPTASSMEVLFEGKHRSNLVSLVTATDPTAGKLFKWDNQFSWSYTGDVADSIKERVKKAGGNVTGELCCRLSWSNHDDLDLHMREPKCGHIYFGNKTSATGGALDVDMNAGSGTTRTPVENIFYKKASKMPPGSYVLSVNQYSARDTTDVGFTVEIEALGETYQYHYNKAVTGTVQVATIDWDGKTFTLSSSMTNVAKPQKVWGITTENWVPVSALMLSPNFWSGEEIGNKHFMFMLRDCVSEDTARGFYNEFLRSDIDKHRKVLEIAGSKMRAQPDVDQMSGIGFSSTMRNDVHIRVKGATQRVVKVTF